ncbi:MAG: hypothetical protein R3D89_12175 [Sphingomonadaceae bacterium]
MAIFTIEGSEKADVIGGPDFYRSTINGLAGDDRLTGNDYEDEI